MSFNLYLCSYSNGEPSGIDVRCVRDAFGNALVREVEEFHLWHLEYGHEVNCCDVYTHPESDNTTLKSLMVSRPTKDERLWASLFRIMQLGNVVLFFPGCQSPLFASAEAVKHFPRDMIDALGEPKVISSGVEILSAINAA